MKGLAKIILFAAMTFLMTQTAYSAEVKNERVRREGNRVLLEYDLEGGKEAEVLVSITIEGRKYAANELHLEGDYGKVKSGKNRRVYWNILQDFPRGLYGNFEASIEAWGGEIAGMVFVKGGCFDMGDTFGDGEADEKPVHQVCVDDFYLGKYEVTVGEFREFVKKTGYARRSWGCSHYIGDGTWEPSEGTYWDDPGFSQTDNNPVACVSWNDANEFVNWKSKTTGDRYRLPTEAEWEYAARSGGKKENWAGTSNESLLGEYAWYKDNSRGKTHPVGQKRPNGLGLYDMSGNVWEWTGDLYDDQYYRNSPKDNPNGPSDEGLRVFRGGSWGSDPGGTRASDRVRFYLDAVLNYGGFRLARTK